MSVSYNGLWKLLIDKNMKKMDLVENENIGISTSTLAKMTKGETVSLSILEKPRTDNPRATKTLILARALCLFSFQIPVCGWRAKDFTWNLWIYSLCL